MGLCRHTQSTPHVQCAALADLRIPTHLGIQSSGRSLHQCISSGSALPSGPQPGGPRVQFIPVRCHLLQRSRPAISSPSVKHRSHRQVSRSAACTRSREHSPLTSQNSSKSGYLSAADPYSSIPISQLMSARPSETTK